MNVCVRVLGAATLAGSLAAGHVRADFTYTKFDGPAPNVNGTLVSGINNSGVVDGVTIDANFNRQGFTGTPPGQFTPFALPAGSLQDPQLSILGGVNNHNEVVGFTPTDAGNTDVFTIHDGVATHLALPNGFGNASARGINDAGVIDGSHTDSLTGHTVGYVRDAAGQVTTFSATPTTTMTLANGIKNDGTIVGSYSVVGGLLAGYERAANGAITLLATPTSIGGIAVSRINYQGINNFGATAGTFQNGGDSFGFVRDAAGDFSLILVPGTMLNTVFGINDDGTVAGTYVDAGGDVLHSFIATPSAVPEPTSLTLAGVGVLAGLGRALRFRRRAAGA
jgi:PEP-CTERM motif